MDSRPSDEMPLVAVAERDMGAFRTLYERHAGWLAIRLGTRRQRAVLGITGSGSSSRCAWWPSPSRSVAEARALARGIYPPLLAEQGLVMALRAQAARSPVPVVLDADQIGRYPQDTESTVYFCTLEALQNVAKHARASRATIRLSGSGDALEFSISDDGAGFRAGTSHGSGLQGMSDRLAAHGGTLTVRSRPGQGTTITGQLPTSERTAAAGFPAASPG